MQTKVYTLFKQVTLPLLLLSGVSTSLLIARAIATDGSRYWFLPWNLFLAWIPYLLVFLLVRLLTTRHWVSWQALLVTVLWLGFLPNTFYIVTDLIHIHASGEISVLFDVMMMSLFVFTGILLGFVSLLLFQQELEKRLKPVQVYGVMAFVIMLSSFAIYLGRYLRWNTWDILMNPAGLMLDITDRIVQPYNHPVTVTTTLMFSLFIGVIYFSLIRFIRALRGIIK